MRDYGQQRPGGPLANAFRTPANVANTSVQYHAGKLLALYEGGRPWELDPDTLETLGEYDYDGALRSSSTYSAHPTWDPATARALQLRDPVRAAHEAAHLPGRHARQAAPPARDQAAVPDDQPRLRAHVEVHGVRDRSARPAGAALPARASRASTSHCASTARRRHRSSSPRGTAASRASPSASRSSTTTSTTRSTTAMTSCSTWSATRTTTTSTAASATSQALGFDDLDDLARPDARQLRPTR